MRFGFFYEPTPAANRCDTDAPLVCAEGIPAANRCDTDAPPVCAEGIPAANRCDTDAPPVCAEGIPVAIPPPPLVEVFDFWNAELRQLTFHAGDPWSISYGRREERKNLQFVALAAEAPGAVPVYDWWSERDRRLTIHPPPAWEGESRRGLQFYAFEQPAEGTVAVHAYWNSSLKQITAHAGPPWGKDERTTPHGTILHAYPNHAAAPPNSVIARALYASEAVTDAQSIAEPVAAAASAAAASVVAAAATARSRIATHLAPSAEQRAGTLGVAFVAGDRAPAPAARAVNKWVVLENSELYFLPNASAGATALEAKLGVVDVLEVSTPTELQAGRRHALLLRLSDQPRKSPSHHREEWLGLDGCTQIYLVAGSEQEQQEWQAVIGRVASALRMYRLLPPVRVGPSSVADYVGKCAIEGASAASLGAGWEVGSAAGRALSRAAGLS